MFITFEGIDGAGKSQQAKLLAQYFTQNQIPVVLTRAPGGTDAGASIRKLIMETSTMSPSAELLLFFADLFELVEKIIVPSLTSGNVVICDRFLDSTRVYQGLTWGQQIINFVAETVPGSVRTSGGVVTFPVPIPDLTFVLDLDPRVAAIRMNANESKKSRYDVLGLEFFTYARDAYRFLSRRYPERIVMVDATPDANTVALKIKTKVMSILETDGAKPI